MKLFTFFALLALGLVSICIIIVLGFSHINVPIVTMSDASVAVEHTVTTSLRA